MPACIDTYVDVDNYLKDKNILIRKKICQIYMLDEDDRIPSGSPEVVMYTVSIKNETTLKNAYVRLGDVEVGPFYTLPQYEGIFIEEIPMPEPFEWKIKWPTLDKMVKCDIPSKIRTEFDIDIASHIRMTPEDFKIMQSK
mgnify:CR=1 FL=1